jgi:hypothetical protein
MPLLQAGALPSFRLDSAIKGSGSELKPMSTLAPSTVYSSQTLLILSVWHGKKKNESRSKWEMEVLFQSISMN